MLFEKLDDFKGQANVLNNIGAVYYASGDLDNALDYIQQSLAMQQKQACSKHFFLSKFIFPLPFCFEIN